MSVEQLITEHLDIWTAADTEKKSGRGRSSGSTGSVYGVKKLRELILELAVRGKLVPQDESDEPASELLKRIAAEKAKLVAEGKIKKDKSVSPSIEDNEKPFELPQGWAYSYLGDAVEIIRGITFPGSEKSNTPEKGRIACLRTTNVQDQIEWDDLLYIREQFVSREDQILMPRDIVMSMANSRELVGKVALVGEEIQQKTSFGGFLGVLRPFLIEPRFIMALLRTPHIRNDLIDSASQTTNIANISLAKLKPLFFAIPPIAEQHRIVAKVDELMALCDQLENQHNTAAEAHEKLVTHLLGTLTQSQNAEDFNTHWQRISEHFDTLFTTESSIDTLKQTLLQLAVMGKLVPQDPNDEPASELLKRIQAEKAKLIAEGKIKKDKPLAEISDEEKPFDLPVGWEWVRINTIGHDWGQKTPTSDFTYIEVSAIDSKNGIISTPQLVEFENAPSRARKIVKAGTVIYSTVRPYLLNIAVIEKEFIPEPIASTAFAIVHPFCSMPPRYFLFYFRSPIFVSYVESVQMGIAYPAINDGQFFSGLLALPPLAEQHRIVAKVDELMTLCDQLKFRLTEANLLQQKLADVVIEQAIN